MGKPGMGKRTSVYLTAEDLRRIGWQPGASLIGLIREALTVRETAVPPPGCDEHGPVTRSAAGGRECAGPERASVAGGRVPAVFARSVRLSAASAGQRLSDAAVTARAVTRPPCDISVPLEADGAGKSAVLAIPAGHYAEAAEILDASGTVLWTMEARQHMSDGGTIEVGWPDAAKLIKLTS